jgi:hypothetical protein
VLVVSWGGGGEALGLMDDDDPGPQSARRALIGLMAIVVAIVAVLFIVHRLDEAARIQDLRGVRADELRADRGAGAVS